MEAKVIKGREPISEEEMYRLYDVNKEFRDTAKLKHNNWVTTVKTKEWDIAQAINHQTTIDFKPKYGTLIPEWTVEILTALLAEKWVENGLQWPSKGYSRASGDLLGWLMLTDLHINAQDIQWQSFSDRVKSTNDRISRVMDRLLKFDPSKLLIPNMGDLNNSEVKHFTSSLKTPMQDNIAQKEWYKRLLEWEIVMLESMRQYWLPIKYIKLNGNHDEYNSYLSGIALQYYFKDLSDTEIELGKNRHYEIRGSTMIALSHWDRWEWKKLFQMVVDECIAKETQKLENLYAYLWHHHRDIVQQEWPLQIRNLQAPNIKTEFCEKYGMDMRQSMTGFIRWKEEGQILEVRW